MAWRDEERTQRSAISPWLGMDAPPPTVSDGRYPPRDYEPARGDPPREMVVPDDFMALTESADVARGATATMAPQLEQMRVRDRDAAFAARRNFPEPGSLNAPPRPPSDAPAADPRSRWRTFVEEGLTGLWSRPDANPAQFPESRFASPRTATGRAPATTPSATGDYHAMLNAQNQGFLDMPEPAAPAAPSATRQAEHTPHPTIPGVYQRVGANGKMEFYDIPGDRRAAGEGSRTAGGYRIPDEARQLRQQAQWAQINARALMEKAAEYPGTPYAQRLQARAQALLGDAAQNTQFAQLVMEQSGAIEANRARAGSGGGDGIYDVARALQVDQERARELLAPPEEVTTQLDAVRKRAEADPRAANDLQRTQAALNIVQNTRANYASQYGEIPSWHETLGLLLSDDFYENDPDTFALIDFAFGRQGFADGGMVMADPISFSKGGYVPDYVGQGARINAALAMSSAANMLRVSERPNKADPRAGRAAGGAASVGARSGGGGGGGGGANPTGRAAQGAKNFAETGSINRWEGNYTPSASTGPVGPGPRGGGGGATAPSGGGGGAFGTQRGGGVGANTGPGGFTPETMAHANASGQKWNAQQSGGPTVKKAGGGYVGAVQRYATGGLTTNSTSSSTAPSGAFPSLLSAMGGIFAKKETGMGIENQRQTYAAEADKFNLDRQPILARQQDQQYETSRREARLARMDANRPAGFTLPTSSYNFAEGGYIDDMPDDVMLGLDGPAPQMGAMDMMGGGMMGGIDPMEMEYEEYAASAQQLGLPPLSFEQYISLMQQVPADGQGMPQGDPSVGGKMVVDPDPNASTDSIPAMIDGQQPAALDSGEFVIPRHAVLFHGVDKLKKLIAQAEAQEARG